MTIANLEATKTIFDVQMIQKPEISLIESNAISAFMENVIEILTAHKTLIDMLEGQMENRMLCKNYKEKD